MFGHEGLSTAVRVAVASDDGTSCADPDANPARDAIGRVKASIDQAHDRAAGRRPNGMGARRPRLARSTLLLAALLSTFVVLAGSASPVLADTSMTVTTQADTPASSTQSDALATSSTDSTDSTDISSTVDGSSSSDASSAAASDATAAAENTPTAAPDPSEVSAAVSAVAPDDGTASDAAPTSVTADPAADQALVTSTPAVTVSDPDTSAGTVQLSAPDAPDGSADIGIGIPGSQATEQTTDSDVAVYTGTSPDASTAVQPNEDGVNLLTVISGPDAPTSYSFPLQIPDGATITPDGAGGYLIQVNGITVSAIAAPWAQDAAGNPLSTSYSLTGDTLTQTIDTTGATFPVTADPAVTISCNFPWNNCHFDLSRSLTRSIDSHVARYANASAGAVAAAFAAACFPAGGFPAVICAGIGAIWGGYVIDQLNYATAHNECLSPHFRLLPVPSPTGVVDIDNGSGCTNS